MGGARVALAGEQGRRDMIRQYVTVNGIKVSVDVGRLEIEDAFDATTGFPVDRRSIDYQIAATVALAVVRGDFGK